MTAPRLHVALMVGSLRMGGAERMMINTANALSSKCDVSLISLTGGSDLEHTLQKQVKLYSLHETKSFRTLPSLCRLVKKIKPDVLISTQIHVNLLAVLLKFICRIPAKIILREATTPGSHMAHETGFRWMMVKWAVRRLYPRADAIVAICEAVRDDLVVNGFARANKVHVIYNPVVNELLYRSMQMPAEHEYFKSGKPVIISVGRLARAKNFPLLFHAFRRLLDARDVRLLLIGEGPEKTNLENLARETGIAHAIDFAGMLNNPYPYLKKSSVYVLSSLYEGLPNALIEAMACGTQLVSVDCPGGSREVLENGAVGRLVAMNDPEALAQAMIDALDRPIEKTMLENSVKRFEASKTADDYMGLFNRLLAR